MDGQEPKVSLGQLAVELRPKLMAFFATRVDSTQAEDYYQSAVCLFLARAGKDKDAKPLDNPKAYLWGIARRLLCVGPYLGVRKEKQPTVQIEEVKEPMVAPRMEDSLQAAYLAYQLRSSPEYLEVVLRGEEWEVSELAERRGIGSRSMSGRLCRLKSKFLADHGHAVSELFVQ